MIDEWRLLIVEVKNSFLHKSTIINRQSQFSSTNLRLSAQQKNKASTTKLTTPVSRCLSPFLADHHQSGCPVEKWGQARNQRIRQF
jgi:hypothetical protein